MRVIILAAGEATRWDNHLGLPKHLATLRGETLLARNVRLVRELQPDADIRIVVREIDDRYYNDHATLELAHLNPENSDADKFLSSAHLWHPSQRTVLLYGDTYCTRAAMQHIVSPRRHDDGWHIVARFGPGTFTGTEWGENLAHVIDPPAHPAYLDGLLHLVDRHRRGDIWRLGGWEQYALLAGGDLEDPAVNLGHATDIDDWSDDFDYPADYDRWCQRYAAAPAHLQALAE